jgi:hypothetical protein
VLIMRISTSTIMVEILNLSDSDMGGIYKSTLEKWRVQGAKFLRSKLCRVSQAISGK